MNKALKIFIWVVVILGVLAGIFLLTAKKKPQVKTPTKVSQTIQQAAPVSKPVVTPKTTVPAPATTSTAEQRKALIRSQWTQCKNKTLTGETNLFWNVNIIESIPTGGTYAKGNLDNDSVYPVHVIIKSDSQNAEKIKAMLVVGKTAFLRGTCNDVAVDNAVVLQVF